VSSISTDPDDVLQAALAAARATQSALSGDALGAVGHALDAALALVPHDELAPHLTKASIRRAKYMKDAADLAKFGPDGQGGLF